MQLDAEDDDSAFYRPPVYPQEQDQQQAKAPGNTAIDRARANMEDDSD